ncbi:MAG: hypothetical protein J0G30_03380 [Actinomycetales bacterium]|nr:hypothetical protein [Actinomycetales bacterium]
MAPGPADAAIARPRAARQLLLALLGEYVVGRDAPVPAAAIIDALVGAGASVAAVRTALDRATDHGLLRRHRLGREVLFELTETGTGVLEEGANRVHLDAPFEPAGAGWTLVTFSMPEGQRRLRHQLRAALTWAGFAPLRDGLWLAPGEVDVDTALGGLAEALPPAAMVAFRARDLPGFGVDEAVRAAWDIDGIRAEHVRFAEAWDHPGAAAGVGALSARVMLVADWLALLRADPRLPRSYFGADWPAERSLRAYRARLAELGERSEKEFARLADRPLGDASSSTLVAV